MMKLFNSELPYKNGSMDKLAIFDGNVAVSSVVNTAYGDVKTIIAFRRVVKPEDKNIGDYDDEKFQDVNGYAFHFQYPESVQVVIDTLEEIKNSMKLFSKAEPK